MSLTALCVFPSQQTKLDMAPRLTRGKEGAVIADSVNSYVWGANGFSYFLFLIFAWENYLMICRLQHANTANC